MSSTMHGQTLIKQYFRLKNMFSNVMYKCKFLSLNFFLKKSVIYVIKQIK
jgi:hypothetical protein